MLIKEAVCVGLFLRKCLGLLLLAFVANASSIAQESNKYETALTIAVASNFRFPLEQIIASSDRWSKQNLKIVTGSSGVLFAQITKGAPFDIFLSADTSRPASLVEQGLAHSLMPYAIGKLVLWPVPSNKMPSAAQSQDANLMLYLKKLINESVGKFAIAHPNLAPFGYSAKQYLDVANIDVNKRLVLGNNVTQAFQFIDSGNATMGIIAESLLIQAKQQFKKNKYNNYIILNSATYPEITQSLVILNRNKHTELALAFVTFFNSQEVQEQLKNLGYFSIKGRVND